MPTVADVASGADFGVVIAFLIWGFVVTATAWLLFASMPAITLLSWYSKHFKKTPVELRKVLWEMEWNTPYTPEKAKLVAGRSEFNELQPQFTDNERMVVKRRMMELRKFPWHNKVIYYLVECPFCQCFWAAAIWWLVAYGLDKPGEGFATCLAFGFIGSVLYPMPNVFKLPKWHGQGSGSAPRPRRGSGSGGCNSPGCGG